MLNQPRILVCTDFSEASDRALKEGSRLAQKSGGELHVLHVTQYPWMLQVTETGIVNEELASEVSRAIRENCLYQFDEQLKRTKVSASTVLRFDTDIKKTIYDIVRELKVSLLVLGHTNSTIDKILPVGSFARKIASSSEVPVLIVKNDMPVDKVAALVDGNEDFRPILDRAVELSYLYSAQLNVLSLLPKFPGIYQSPYQEIARPIVQAINHDSEKEINTLKLRIKDALCGQKAELYIANTFEKNIGNHLIEILNENNINLAVLKRHHKSFLEKFMFGSVSHTVMENFKGNVLIFQENL